MKRNASNLFLVPLFFTVSLAHGQDSVPSPKPISADSEDRIFVDFKNKNILVYGLFSAATQGQRNGVDGEIAARRDGKQILTDHAAALCKNSSFDKGWNERMTPRKDWNPNFLVSQGSEIFPGSNLLIRLTAPLEKIFQKYPPNQVKPIQNSQKEEFAFKIPPLSLGVLRCGATTLKLGNGKKVFVAPGYASSLPAGTTLIQLAVAKDGLEPATPADTTLLQRSEFLGKQDESEPALLPVEFAVAN
jgi:hypothetical protein